MVSQHVLYLVEVLNLIKQYELPFVVAINKVDREYADPEALMFSLAEHGVEVEDVGGDIPCAQVSALNKIGLDVLEQKVIQLAESLKLKEAHDCPAECIIVESNHDEDSSQVTACVVVRKGVLKVGDPFVCGLTEGKVKFILYDGGKYQPNPLYNHIVSRRAIKSN